MAIWGWRARRATTGAGIFRSPAVGGDAPYRLVETDRIFYLMSIPVRRVRMAGPMVECGVTGDLFAPNVLAQRTDIELAAELAAAACEAVAAVVLADDQVTDEERAAAIEVCGEFVRGYDDDDLEADLDRVGLDDPGRRLASVAEQLDPHGRERVLAAITRVMKASGPASELTVREVRAMGRALGMSDAHVEGVILHALDRS